jgi:hypothetical protein
MIAINSSFPEFDSDAKRRRALTKVYRLLVRLAEEAEHQTAPPHIVNTEEEKIEQSTLMRVESVNEEISDDFDSKISVCDTEQEGNSVPLKSNIPS